MKGFDCVFDDWELLYMFKSLSNIVFLTFNLVPFLLLQDISEAKEFLKQRGVDVGSL